MKKILLITVMILVATAILLADQVNPPAQSKMLQSSVLQNSCSFELNLSNFGVIGAGSNGYPRLEFPTNSGIDYLYQGSLWIGGKKYRRNADGIKLFWVAQHPSADSTGMIAEGEPGWNSNMRPVVDTLTSVGFDGDMDVYELLPAYNPLVSGNNDVADLYDQYNAQDVVLKSYASHPMPRPFVFPDPEGTYCFTIPQDVTGNEPGFETCTTYYYDFDPFGTTTQRDWGSNQSSSLHVPLGLVIEQKSYAWPLQNYDKMVIFKYELLNTSQVDTLFDLAVSYYLDCDIGPISFGAAVSPDDVSGYVLGNGYEFGYSRDADTDGGLTPGWLGCKMLIANQNLNHDCYYWSVGNGPIDAAPIDFPPGFSYTSNQKYWLQTGRNPEPYSPGRFNKLRGGPDGTITEYEQPAANDTRFLISAWGNLPTPGNPNPIGRLNLPPGQSMTIYMALFPNYSLDSLKVQAVRIENFINTNMTISSTSGLTSMPYITNLEQTAIGTVHCDWFSYTNPDHFELMYKPIDAPASQWQSIIYAGTTRSGQFTGLPNLQDYKFKVASIFNPGPGEVYLESQTLIFLIDDYNPNQDEYAVLPTVFNYPNPFTPATGTCIRFDPAKFTNASLSIYNTKGQKVKTYDAEELRRSSGSLTWTGLDENGRALASGVYYYVLKSAKANITRKMLFLK